MRELWPWNDFAWSDIAVYPLQGMSLIEVTRTYLMGRISHPMIRMKVQRLHFPSLVQHFPLGYIAVENVYEVKPSF
jgi:hypothetical protein